MFKQFPNYLKRFLRRKSLLKVNLAVYLLPLLIVATLVFIFARPASTPSSSSKSGSGRIDLISGQDWSHFAGATQNGNTVRISPLGRVIVNQDGSGGQPNPPVNVRGPSLTIDGDFSIDAKLSGIPATGSASIDFYGSIPIIYDEWRYESPRLEVAVSQYKLTISQWNGISDNPTSQKSWTTTCGQSCNISIKSHNYRLYIVVNGHELGDISSQNIFGAGHVWIGADASVGTQGWDLQSLSAEPLNHGKIQIYTASALKISNSDSLSLRSLAARNSRDLPIGAAVANYAVFRDAHYRELAASQFSMITPENEMKPQFIHPQSDVYSFKEADSLVEFALANGIKIHGHTLEFSEANPRWMQQLPLDQRQKVLSEHIRTVVNHFGNRVDEWDVVDEPLNDNDNNNGNSDDLRQNIWFAAMGENYIDTAFKAAHDANPNAKLYINEYGLEADGPRWNELLRLVVRLQARKVPIDGVGFQAHVYEPGDEIDAAVLENHMQVLASLGLKSRISEMDVYGDNLKLQAQQYSAVLNACLSVKSCTSFTTWGITDKYGSTTENHKYPLEYGNDLIWDENLTAKPVLKSMQNDLHNR